MNPSILILLTIAVTAASSQPLPPGLITTIISDLFASNTRPVVINKRNIQKPIRRFAITDLPKTVKAEPRKIIIQNVNGLPYPNNNVVIKNFNTVPQRNVILHKGAGDRVVINQTPVLKPVEGVPKTVVVRKEIPKRVVVNEGVIKPQVVAKQVPQKVVVKETKTVYPVKTKQVMPLPPLVKVATPLPQSRGQFLRKYPIPPPTI
ncbi:unnamed protein product [Chrysodeixis includens]|uniref:Uncharacterized protein n=1 Tax=Chrysodeixis includens TaxID=689277 RepID=A0A9N8KZ25_CHRIL|nr:unnamed protein product [Chrysodeixis includens]